MKKVCIFRLNWNGSWYYVYEVPLSGVNLTTMYRVYSGRKWLSHIAFYHKQNAIEGCLRAALGVNVSLS